MRQLGHFLHYAELSNAVYHPGKVNIVGQAGVQQFYVAQLDQFLQVKVSGWLRCVDRDIDLIDNGSFYAALYLKFFDGVAKEAVIAVRGTANIDNGLVDIASWYSDYMDTPNPDRLPAYFYRLLMFFSDVEEYLAEYFPGVSLSLTGHSLGGALAQLLVALARRLYPTVTFNAPGIGHMPHVTDQYSDFILNINSLYGIINKIGKVLGKIEYIDVRQAESDAKQIFSDYVKAERLSPKNSAADNLIQRYGLTQDLNYHTIGTHYGDVYEAMEQQHSIVNLVSAMKESMGLVAGV